MKTAFFGILGFFAFLVFIVGMTFLGKGLKYASFKLWEPKMENAKHEVYTNSTPFVDGKLQDLSNYRHQWMVSKDETEKGAIEAVVRTQFSGFDGAKYIKTPELYQFYKDCMNK